MAGGMRTLQPQMWAVAGALPRTCLYRVQPVIVFTHHLSMFDTISPITFSFISLNSNCYLGLRHDTFFALIKTK